MLSELADINICAVRGAVARIGLRVASVALGNTLGEASVALGEARVALGEARVALSVALAVRVALDVTRLSAISLGTRRPWRPRRSDDGTTNAVTCKIKAPL